jgi:branched-chain amino acid aminotransferase
MATRLDLLPIGVTRVAQSRISGVDLSNVPFSSVWSDHVFVAEYRNNAWTNARIQPFAELALLPSVSALQYGLSVFEGLKAHKTNDGSLLLFRPTENARRLQRSAARLAMTAPPESLFLAGLRELVTTDRAWIPPVDQGALYIRPVLFSTDPSVGVKPADRLQFLIFTFPFNAYYTAPVNVIVNENYVRAFPGGTGDIKACGNYAAALLADQHARAAGYQSTMWLDAKERRFVEECGVMNVFFVIAGEVYTPALTGTILPGVTRDSVIRLLRDAGHVVREERVAIADVVRAHQHGSLTECFGTGTAATVSHIGSIRYRDTLIELPPVERRTVGAAVRSQLVSLMTGANADAYGWVERIR